MAELLEFDPVSEDSANSPLSVMTSTYRVMAHSYASPEEEVLYASSIDTEGSVRAASRTPNRTITMTIEVAAATAAALRTAVTVLQRKVAKIRREGGTLKRTSLSGEVIVFDLITAGAFDPRFDITFETGNLTQVDLSFTAEPYGRGAEVTSLTAHTSSSVATIFTETGITGDVPAAGRLQITDTSGSDQFWGVWGLRSKTYDSAATAALFYEAEGRTLLGGAVTGSAPGGSSGASGIQGVLSPNWQAYMSTQATAGGAHLTHVGSYRVLARIGSDMTSGYDVALEWSTGDFRNVTRNDPVRILEQTGLSYIVDLGTVTIPKVVTGTQRWEGRIIARSPTVAAGVLFYIDYIALVPLEASGEMRGTWALPSPTAFLTRDEFNQTAGALNAKTATTGGAWTTSGVATDFQVDATAHKLTRTSSAEAAYRKAAVGSNATDQAVQADVYTDFTNSANVGPSYGVMARYVSGTGVFLGATIGIDVNQRMYVTLGEGTTASITGSVLDQVTLPWAPSKTLTIRLQAAASGRVAVWVWPAGTDSPGDPVIVAYSTNVATGGNRATGQAGLIHWHPGLPAASVVFDNFQSWVPVSDAAVYGSQATEVRSDQAIRKDATGAVWAPLSVYEGDYCLVPPAGAEGRTVQFIVITSRSGRLPGTVAWDPVIDARSIKLFYTPRFLVVP